jgi:hypothetical protein
MLSLCGERWKDISDVSNSQTPSLKIQKRADPTQKPRKRDDLPATEIGNRHEGKRNRQALELSAQA